MSGPGPGQLVNRFRQARSDPELAVLEGFHPLKHALRFRAPVLTVMAPDPAAVAELAEELAPDLVDRLRDLVDPVSPETFQRLSPHPPSSGVIALAERPPASPRQVLDAGTDAPVVFLENPTHLGNLGAAVRVAAAAGGAGVLASGEHDPWHPRALRGSAGLHYAVPVAHVEELPAGDRPLLALDPEGEPLAPDRIPDRAVLAFGSERYGLRPDTLERADRRLRIPMREGVSSLNLATSVAVLLYVWRLRRAGRGTSAGRSSPRRGG